MTLPSTSQSATKLIAIIKDLSQSQSLFSGNSGDRDLQDEGHERQGTSLDVMANDIAEMRKEMTEIKAMISTLTGIVMKQQQGPFSITSASCRGRFYTFLKDLFVRRLWIEEEDEELKMEIKACLQAENRAGDSKAYQKMRQYSVKCFTEFRNQVKRKILNVPNLVTLPLPTLTEKMFNTYVSVNLRTPRAKEERERTCLLMRRQIGNKGRAADDMKEFWPEIRKMFEKVMKDETELKKYIESDNRRVKRALREQ